MANWNDLDGLISEFHGRKEDFEKYDQRSVTASHLLNLQTHLPTTVGVVKAVQKRTSNGGNEFKCILTDFTNDGNEVRVPDQITFINNDEIFSQLQQMAKDGCNIVVSGGDIYYEQVEQELGEDETEPEEAELVEDDQPF